MSRSTARDARVGLALVLAAAGVIALIVVASGGPGYLMARRAELDVLFRDGQGIRVGHPVRIAGLDAGRVTAVEIVEHGGALRARVRIAVAEEIAGRLRQDAVIVISAGLTGSSSVNIASVGETGVAWVPGQPIEGVESSLFDPILEEIGLGPVERENLGHTITEVRKLVDDVAPRARKIVASAQESVAAIREAAEAAGPAVAGASERIGPMVETLDQAATRAEGLIAKIDAAVDENREDLDAIVADLREVSAGARELVAETGPELGRLIAQMGETRKRADLLLYHADVAAEQLGEVLVTNRAEIDRSIANVRDITDFGRMTVQKIYSNPLVLSPLYKPGRDVEAAMAQFETAGVLLKAAGELSDTAKRLEVLRDQPGDPRRQQAIDGLLRQAAHMEAQMAPMLQQMAAEVQAPTDPRGRGGLLPGARGPGR